MNESTHVILLKTVEAASMLGIAKSLLAIELDGAKQSSDNEPMECPELLLLSQLEALEKLAFTAVAPFLREHKAYCEQHHPELLGQERLN